MNRSAVTLVLLGAFFLALTADLLWFGRLERLIERQANHQDKPQTVLNLGANAWLGYEPLFFARKLGFYNNEEIRLVEYTSATMVIKAFKNGVINAATLTMDEVLLLAETDEDFKVVLLCDISKGGDSILAKPDYKDLKSLAGKRIGLEQSALGGFFFSRALDIEGLTPDQFQLVYLEADEHEQAFLKGEVEAVVTFEPI